MNIQWYPGHMTKTRRMIAQQIKNVDAICEILDARIPISSRNPDVDELTAGKPRLVILNRVDQADGEATRRWAAFFRGKGYAVLECSAKAGTGTKQFAGAIRELLAEKVRAWEVKGAQRTLRVMVLGIPNVGKSTFINSFVGKTTAKTGNKPGVTKGNQWIRLNKNVELLDTPGILWPRFEDKQVGVRLALVGSINDNILNRTELAGEGIRFLQESYPQAIASRYDISGDGEVYAVLAEIAEARKCLQKGGEPDIDKAAALFLDDLRSGRLGRLSLEQPEGSE